MMSRGHRSVRCALVLLCLFALASLSARPVRAQTPSSWRQPPQQILEVLHAPELPFTNLSPTGEVLALMTPVRYPPIADLAQPMLPLAGVRINPRTNGHHASRYSLDLTLKRVRDGRERPVALPAGARVSDLTWSADGRRFAFLNEVENGIELMVGETKDARVKPVPDLRLNPLLGYELAWMPDGKTLLVKRIPPDRGDPPPEPETPPGPNVQECQGESASSTYEARDVLTCPRDADLFAYYTLSQLALVEAEKGRVTSLGRPGILGQVEISPDGRHVLVERLHPPWSYSHAFYRFPRDVEIWNLKGEVERVLARLPLADQVPIHGVPEGPRAHAWRPTEPATLIWLEALDGGDPGRAAEHRDRVMLLSAPFQDPPRELCRTPHRVSRWAWGEKDGLLLIWEYERERRWLHVRSISADEPEPRLRDIFDLSANDRYKNPGRPVYRSLANGHWVLAQEGNAIFLSGEGATPEGDRPFLDRFSLTTLTAERLFRCDRSSYERFIDWIDLGAGSFLTRRESPREVPNYLVRTLTEKRRDGTEEEEAVWASEARPLTEFTDPTPQIRDITRRIVTYEREDGTPLSFTLFLPPGYVEGTRLPTVVDAYPLEYSDPETAGQVAGSAQRFTRLMGTSALFFLLDGYAVLEDVAMPVIGDPDTAYDTFIEQLVAGAGAAIKKATEIGVTDPERVGVMGHSHGGLMTATLVAHSDLFRAGIARSGAYNHTMRPFGFQNERRTLWQAPETYIRLSPVMHADKINEPLLLIHGEVDQNPGTVPLQSEKLYQAIRGTGGTARLVMLPHESHGYRSRESVEHVLAEQLDWFGRWVKNAEPRGGD